MPIFEFTCEDCGETFEELVRSAGNTGEVTCPACQGKRVTKLISLFASKAPGSKATANWGGAPARSCNTSSL
jgi:putative FmdB family regulatory protein